MFNIALNKQEGKKGRHQRRVSVENRDLDEVVAAAAAEQQQQKYITLYQEIAFRTNKLALVLSQTLPSKQLELRVD